MRWLGPTDFMDLGLPFYLQLSGILVGTGLFDR